MVSAIDNRTFSMNCECKICGTWQTIILNKKDFEDWDNGDKYIQDALHYLTASERELLISQTCNDCWKKFWD
jgi:hypothetical protein|tara:strand:+ start:145 stop:360 length:216 start_codon:yes stop_codon:yes gene_type:complete